MGGIENRTSRNLLIKPKAQMKFLLLLSLGFLILAVLAVVTMAGFGSYLQTLQDTHQIDTQTVILVASYVDSHLRVVAGVAGVFAVLGVAFGVMLTHRIYGPVVQIRGHLLKMNNGDYSGRIKLRQDDDFQDLADDLNSLTESLAQRH